MPPSERTNKQQIITALNYQFIMTNNNHQTYERPTLQVLFVEAESVMAGSGDKINSPANGYSWGDDDVENL